MRRLKLGGNYFAIAGTIVIKEVEARTEADNFNHKVGNYFKTEEAALKFLSKHPRRIKGGRYFTKLENGVVISMVDNRLETDNINYFRRNYYFNREDVPK